VSKKIAFLLIDNEVWNIRIYSKIDGKPVTISGKAIIAATPTIRAMRNGRHPLNIVVSGTSGAMPRMM
jgi:hypothetical protein